MNTQNEANIYFDFNPFNLANMNKIFKISQSKPNRLISRECSWLEFKESFNWGSRNKYTKTFAAFANTKGGYIVYPE